MATGSFTQRRIGAILLSLAAIGCTSVGRPVVAPRSSESAAAAQLEVARSDTVALLRFLRAMPKGGDLHSHLSGAVYAESYVRWAAEDGLCIVRRTATLVPPPCTDVPDRVPAARLLGDAALRDSVIDAWSVRNWRPGDVSGHQQFFDAFAKFSLVARGRMGDMLAEVVARAAAQRVSYLELMMNTDRSAAVRLGQRVRWSADLDSMYRRLDSIGLRDSLRPALRVLDEVEYRQGELLRCGRPQADAGCGVVVRYLFQVARNRPPAEVFAQILAGFELARMDPRVVGFNLVAPEDGPVAMRDFPLHMAMIDHLHRRFPEARITLHAGELTDSLLGNGSGAPRSHIRQSIRQGHARRIGHGVDLHREEDPESLLREMAERRILVEIALSSNAIILGVRGARHPLATYLRYGVPVAFVTDDEGIARSDLTHELLAAVQAQALGYGALKTAVRNSLEHAFVEGQSLWRDSREFVPVAACAGPQEGFASARCVAYVRDHPKARLQRDLELALAQFERDAAARQSAEGRGAR